MSSQASRLLLRLAVTATIDPSSIAIDLDREPYNWLGEFARLIETRPPEDARRLFEVVESALHGASAELRDLLIVGFLEDLQNQILNDGGRLADWEPFLGPATRRGWDALVEVWQGRTDPAAFNAFVAHSE